MKPILLFSLLMTSSMLFSGCKEAMEDYEVKGTLQVDARQAGNKRLDVVDVKTGDDQEIHPGRKIIRLRKGDKDKMMIDFMDSRRVRLATIAVPMKNFDEKSESFHADDSEINQNFGIVGLRAPAPVQTEYVNMRAHACKVSVCGDRPLIGNETYHSISCDGFSGELWKVTDSRFNYEIKFMNMGTGQSMATLIATGKINTDDAIINTPTCMPRIEKWAHQGDDAI